MVPVKDRSPKEIKNMYINKTSLISGFLLTMVFGSTLFFSTNLPIYPDEIAYRILAGRFFDAGGMKESLLPYCASVYKTEVPLSLYPAAVFWSVVFDMGRAIDYRLIPFSTLGLAIIVLALRAIKMGDRLRPWLLLLYVPGVMSYALSMIRPEVFIAANLAILAFLGITVQAGGWNSSARKISAALIAVTAYLLTVYLHPKALYLSLPLIVLLFLFLGLAKQSVGAIAAIVAMLLLTGLITKNALDIHTNSPTYSSCPEFPEIEQRVQQDAANPIDLAKDPKKFFQALMAANSGDKTKRAVSQPLFGPHYDIDYLPGVKHQGGVVTFTNTLILFAVLVGLLSVIFFTVTAIRNLVFNKWLKSGGDLIYLSLVVPFSCQYFLNDTKHFYDLALTIFSIGLLAFSGKYLVRLTSALATKFDWATTLAIACTIIVAVMPSAYLNFSEFYQTFSRGYVGPGVSMKIPVDRVHTFIQKNSTDIRHDQPVIVDDFTFHGFNDHSTIYPITYLLAWGTVPGTVKSVIAANPDLIAFTVCGWDTRFGDAELLDRYRFEAEGLKVDLCKWKQARLRD